MNVQVTSREAILQASRELIRQKGWNAVNIRAVAQACHISVGSVYNYFENKTELITAAVESLWLEIFSVPQDQRPFTSFLSCVQWAFDSMRRGNDRYPGFFTMHAVSFLGVERSAGQQRMADTWRHIHQGLVAVLNQDPAVRQDAFSGAFTQDAFVDIVFDLMISALLRQQYDCGGILAMIQRLIY